MIDDKYIGLATGQLDIKAARIASLESQLLAAQNDLRVAKAFIDGQLSHRPSLDEMRNALLAAQAEVGRLREALTAVRICLEMDGMTNTAKTLAEILATSSDLSALSAHDAGIRKEAALDALWKALREIENADSWSGRKLRNMIEAINQGRS